ncbi:sirohydrochlorin cobaltochelatase [Clostridium psychrophilum]|uniref:sirohydrochlorin cobaltochelatase n=1 Tax=Clostridium psychrophilum TaxID=132926 RepID=UPI001C0E0E68|nr:sirohydrochlorin cobaltochelatase [Clostridium psychrophilum]MBU3181827.1 sirohydrochlorin cobaltochelatase [Clostridium psychrophilum]
MKKAILVVSFGTTYKDARKVTIDEIEKKIKHTFEDYDIRMAFTSHVILKILKNRDNIHIDTPEEALEKLRNEGYKDVIVQPLHVIPGSEFDYINNVVKKYKISNAFENIMIGRPLICFKGEEAGVPDDYSIMVDALTKQLPRNDTVILMGHGTNHIANAVYCCFESVLRDRGFQNVHVATVEGYPTLDRVIPNLMAKQSREVTLMPLLLVAGDHVKNDMVGESEDSWKNILESDGFKVKLYLHGLGENSNVQDIYIQHINDVINETFKNVGKTPKGI